MKGTFVPRSPLGHRLVERRGLVLDAAARHRASNVRVFGSVARGVDTEESDIDLLVDFAPGTGLFDLLGLERELREALGVKVDVGSPSSLRSFLRDEVLAEAVTL
jgi:uncharacterized protein